MRKLLILLLFPICLFAQDINNTNNAELTNMDGSVGWVTSSTVAIGSTSMTLISGTNFPTVGSRFTMTQTKGTAQVYLVLTSNSGTGVITFSPAISDGVFLAGTHPYWLYDISTYKTACTDPADFTKLKVCWKSTHSDSTWIVMTREITTLNPERWLCDYSPCDTGTPVYGTTHALTLSNMFPDMTNYPTATPSAYWGYVVGVQTGTGTKYTLGHLNDVPNGGGLWPKLTMKSPATGDAYGFAIYQTGATYCYIGNPCYIQIMTAKTGGVIAGQLYLSALTIKENGTSYPCTLTNSTITCTGAHETVQYNVGQSYAYYNPSGHYGAQAGPVNGKPGTSSSTTALDGYYTTMGSSNGPSQSLRIQTSGSTPVGTLEIDYTLTGANSNTPVGTASQVYTFTTSNPVSQSLSQPVSFPAPYNAQIVQAVMMQRAVNYCSASPTGADSSQDAEYNSGLFPNGNYSSYYLGSAFYDSPAVHLMYSDLAKTTPGTWAGTTSYPYGTIIKANGYLFFSYSGSSGPIDSGAITGSFTSGGAGSPPSFASNTTPGNTTNETSGTGHWYNLGNTAYWQHCAEVTFDHRVGWPNEINAGPTAEWNATMTESFVMGYYRTNDQRCSGSTAYGCSGGTLSTHGFLTGSQKAISDGTGYPNFYLYSYYNQQDNFNLRIAADIINSAISYEMIKGSSAYRDVTLDERVNLMLSELDKFVHPVALDCVNCNAGQSFAMEDGRAWMTAGYALIALERYYNMQAYENTTPDARIPTVVRGVLDYFWNNSWNPFGASCPASGYSSGSSCSMAFFSASYPRTAVFDQSDTELSPMVAVNYAWLWGLLGNSATISGGSTTYAQAANLILGHSTDKPGNIYRQKDVGETHWYWASLNILNGNYVTTVNGFPYVKLMDDISLNPCEDGGSFPCTTASVYGDTAQPYPFIATQNNRSAIPTIGVSGLTVTINWQTSEKLSHSYINWGSSTNCSLHTSSDGGNSTSTANPFIWTNASSFTVASAGTYYFQIQGNDVAGNIAYSNCSATYPSSYSFTVVSPPFVPPPVMTPSSGTYGSAQSVTLFDSVSGATLCYTNDGSTPTGNGSGTCTHGSTYSGAISVGSSQTLKAIGTKSGYQDSSVTTAVYVINGSTGTVIVLGLM